MKQLARKQDQSHSGALPAPAKGAAGVRKAVLELQRTAGNRAVQQVSNAPLDPDVRREMEGHFGADLSHVRVHADGAAADRARDQHAVAFVRGSEVTFSAGMYQPDSEAGRVIVAHELAHVLQQTRNPGQPTLAPTHLEAEADAATVDGGAVAGRAPQGSVQRVPTLLDKIAGEELRRRRRKKAAGHAGKAPPVKPPKAVEAGGDVSQPPERDAAGAPGDAPSQTTAPGGGAEAPAKGPDVCELCQSGLLAEADAVLQKAAAGGDMDEKAIEALQQRLLTAERQGQLAGGPGEGPGPAFAKAVELGELRQRRLFEQADAVRQKAASGGAVEKGEIEAVQQRLLGAERQSQLRGTGPDEGPGPAAEKARELGQLRQRQLLDQADAIRQKAAAGGAVEKGEIEAVQERLLEAERQSQLAGTVPGEGAGPAAEKALELGELRQRRLFEQADALRQKSAAGGAVEKGEIEAVQERLMEAERQSQLRGTGPDEGQGPAADKALELVELREKLKVR